jgi:hypothetical protein
MVEQTGHVVNGWVTVKFADITGWAPLDRLGPPGYSDPAVTTEATVPDPAVSADPGTMPDAGAITDPSVTDPAVTNLAVTDPATEAAVPVAAEATPVS